MNQEQIEHWKAIYEDVYRVDILEHIFIFRALGREEYRDIVELELDLGEFQEEICIQGVLSPESFDFSQGLAGVAEVVSDLIIDASGLHANQAADILQEYRADMDNFDFQTDCIIHEAFPEFPLEEIATWPLRKSLFYLSRAEWILTNLRDRNIIPLNELKQEQQEQQERQQQVAKPRVPEGAIVEETANFKSEKKTNDFTEGQMTEEQVMAMLQQEAASKGQSIGPVKNNMDDIFPELGWFTHEDNLKGNYD